MEDKSEIIDLKEEKANGCYIRQRYLLAVMSFFGLCNVSFLRSQVYVTILAMMNNTHENGTHTGSMNWNSAEEGIFLGAYFYGYVIGNIPGGWLVTRFGSMRTFPLSMFIAAVLNLFTPWAAYRSVYLATAIRSIMGLIQGVSAPATNALWSYWAPPAERSTLVSISTSGFVFGYIIINPSASLIAKFINWESVYYILSGIAITWSIFFYTFFAETPSTNSRISSQEKYFIEKSIGDSTKKKTGKNPFIPWKSILTSKPVFGIFIAQFYDAWFKCAIPAVLPTFVANILHFNITQNGFMLMLPFVLLWLVSIVGGKVADKLRKSGRVSTTFIRKFNTCTALLCSGWLTVVCGYTDDDSTLTIAIICLSFAFSGLSVSGIMPNMLEIAPNHVSIIVALSNTLANSAGFLGPLTAGYVVTDKTNISQWKIFFWITCGISTVSSVVYALIASSDEQKWNTNAESISNNKEQNEKLNVDTNV